MTLKIQQLQYQLSPVHVTLTLVSINDTAIKHTYIYVHIFTAHSNRPRCGTCSRCKSECGSCRNCRDKKKFGGPGRRKQAYLKRKCNNMTQTPLQPTAVGLLNHKSYS